MKNYIFTPNSLWGFDRVHSNSKTTWCQISEG